MDNEIDVLRRDNSRLQLKIRAQEGVFQKLLKEKEQALKAYQEAEEEIRYCTCTEGSATAIYAGDS